MNRGFRFPLGRVCARITAAALFLLSAVFFSCRSFNSVVQEPVLSINSVELADVSFAGVDMICRVDVENPNGFDLPFPKIDYELFVNSNSFVEGILDKGKSLKRRRTTTVDVPVRFTYEGLYKTFASLTGNKETAYNIALALNFPLPLIEGKTFNLDFSGVLPLIEIPKLSPGDFKITKVDFTGIELAQSINIENTNAFPVPFPDVEWEYGVAGVPLLKSALAERDELAPNSKCQADIKIGLSYAELIKSAAPLSGGGEAPSLLSFNSSFPVPAMDTVKEMLDIPGTIPILRPPEVSVRGISIKNLAFQKLEFFVNVEVDNKNSFAMGIDRFDYDVTVNNASWAKGLFQNPPVLKANAKTAVPIPVVIDSLSLVAGITDIISRGASVNYKCRGGMSFSSDFPGLSAIDVPLDLSGSSRLLR